MNHSLLNIAACLCLLTTTTLQAEPIPGIGPVAEIKTVATGFKFTEGPAADGKGNLYFTDIPNNRINILDASGNVSTFLEPSGHCNGLMVGASGTIFACSMDGSLISIDPESKEVTQLATEYGEKRFNAPNDLVLDRQGGIYFTDPRYRAPKEWPQGKEAVYYRAADGTVTRLEKLEHIAPNGIILSPDEKTLYVIPSMESSMYAYPVLGPGKLGPGKVFCEVKQKEDSDGNQGGDGLTIDTNGNLYITTALGLQVFSPSGTALGIIEFPQHPANVTFGGPEGKTLYVTARSGLYSVEMEAKGHVFPGKK